MMVINEVDGKRISNIFHDSMFLWIREKEKNQIIALIELSLFFSASLVLFIYGVGANKVQLDDGGSLLGLLLPLHFCYCWNSTSSIGKWCTLSSTLLHHTYALLSFNRFSTSIFCLLRFPAAGFYFILHFREISQMLIHEPHCKKKEQGENRMNILVSPEFRIRTSPVLGTIYCCRVSECNVVSGLRLNKMLKLICLPLLHLYIRQRKWMKTREVSGSRVVQCIRLFAVYNMVSVFFSPFRRMQ